jgi:hypothetical protein
VLWKRPSNVFSDLSFGLFRVLIFIAESGGLVAFKLRPLVKEKFHPFVLYHIINRHNSIIIIIISPFLISIQ